MPTVYIYIYIINLLIVNSDSKDTNEDVDVNTPGWTLI